MDHMFGSQRCHNGNGRHLKLGGGNCMLVCVCKHTNAMGVWGYVPPQKVCKLDALRVLLRPLLAESGTTVIVIYASSYVMRWVKTSEFPVSTIYRPTESGAGPQRSKTQHSCAVISATCCETRD